MCGDRFTSVIDRDASHFIHIRDPHEYLSMLLNLQMALECDAWVCTQPSNSCQLMNEMRATAAQRARGMWVDLSPETCLVPPCLTGDMVI
jgi:hypothetical protein